MNRLRQAGSHIVDWVVALFTVLMIAYIPGTITRILWTLIAVGFVALLIGWLLTLPLVATGCLR